MRNLTSSFCLAPLLALFSACGDSSMGTTGDRFDAMSEGSGLRDAFGRPDGGFRVDASVPSAYVPPHAPDCDWVKTLMKGRGTYLFGPWFAQIGPFPGTGEKRVIIVTAGFEDASKGIISLDFLSQNSSSYSIGYEVATVRRAAFNPEDFRAAFAPIAVNAAAFVFGVIGSKPMQVVFTSEPTPNPMLGPRSARPWNLGVVPLDLPGDWNCLSFVDSKVTTNCPTPPANPCL